MKIIESTYTSLLADVAKISGFSEIRGLGFDLQWCLKEAPQLDKQLLHAVENGESHLDNVPECLRRLALGSLMDPMKMRLYRQLLLFCYKASITHEPTTTETALRSYVAVSEEVGRNDLSRSCPALLELTRQHVQSVLYSCRWEDFLPSHGPGASTTPKERWTHWYKRINDTYGFHPYYCTGHPEHLAQVLQLAVPVSEIECKVTPVPKDARGPRLVCVHPAEAIWAQQGARRVLEQAIARVRPRSQGRLWPKGHIFFKDQSINGKIALLSSKSGIYSTLDLSEASDRLSEPIVRHLFGRYYEKFACSRAQQYVIQGKRFPMTAYAPMGNATVFPVQSLVFWAICVSSLQSQGCRQPGAAFVFGDDIIVPSKFAPGVCEDLESFGLKINRRKSFIHGRFRESCGIDAFKGVCVTPIRWKTVESPEAVVEIQALSDMAQRLRCAGYEESAVTVYSYMRDVLKRRYGKRLFKTNNPDHGGISEYVPRVSSVMDDAFWLRSVQLLVSPVWRLKYQDLVVKDCDWNHVLEGILSLERTGRGGVQPDPVSRLVRLSRGWTCVILPDEVVKTLSSLTSLLYSAVKRMTTE